MWFDKQDASASAGRIARIGHGASLSGLLVLAVLVSGIAAGGEAAGSAEPAYCGNLAEILAEFVSEDGLVDYAGLQQEAEKLHQVLEEISELDEQTYNNWSEARKKAFWINCFNACTLEAVVVHYPIRPSFPLMFFFPKNSIRQIRGVWDLLEFRVMDAPMTLEEIHDRLRLFDDPRAHLALVHGAVSSPPLRREPYVGRRLDDQLDDQARRFLSKAKNFRIDRDAGKVHLSRIFKWYCDEIVETHSTTRRFRQFGKTERAVLNFICDYVSEEDRAYLINEDYEIEYVRFDWSLNEQKKS